VNGTELKTLLTQGPLLGDGGMGASLVDRGVHVDACMDALNVDDPSVVADVHRSFVEAGARFVETNTFGANRFNLGKFGFEDRVGELNRAGVDIAKSWGVLVVGSVGPLRVRLAPYGRVRPAQAREAFAEQIAALAEAGADFVLIETQSDLVEMEQAVAAAREVCDLAVLVTATFTRDDRTLLGSTPEVVAQRLVELGVDGLGVNCSEGPAQVLRIVDAMRPHAGGRPLIAIPNAGGPARVGSRTLYPATPEYFGEYARAFLASGVTILGGCCGTDPRHIRAMAGAIEAPRQLQLEVLPSVEHDVPSERPSAPTALASRLARGRFVVAVEMDPPRGVSTARLLAGAETLAEAGVDVITVGDMPAARMRMSAWAVCRLIQEHVGVETVLHFPTRGRNILRVQGDLLAAHALGIRNLFVCMGDPTVIGNYPGATDHMDIVPTGLVALAKGSFNEGRDQAGTSIGEPTSFVVGCAVNLAAPDLEREIKLTHRKVRAGADFALSQPVYSPDVVRAFRKAYEQRYEPLELPILVGVLPLVTSRHAEFLHNEIPGISIPDEIRARLRDAGDDVEAEGLRIAIELAREIASDASGLYVAPPFSRYDIAAEIVESVRHS
jgi:homocysteine S-methyltransferase